MPIIPNFSVSQDATTPNLVGISDTSSGSDVAITQRRVYVQDSAGNYLVPSGTTTDYTQWSYSDSTISLNILTQDECVSITVQWLNVSNAVLYTKTQQYPLAEYNKQFFFYTVQLLALTPGVYQDTNFSGNLAIFWSNVVAGINAVEDGLSIAAGQNCFDRATEMRLNQNFYF